MTDRIIRCRDDNVAESSRSGLTFPDAPTLRARGTQRDNALRIAENDISDMLDGLPSTAARLQKVGATHEIVRIPGATHFYPRTSKVTGADGSPTSVEDRVAGFLYNHLKLADLSLAK